jgi:hypothetical protein
MRIDLGKFNVMIEAFEYSSFLLTFSISLRANRGVPSTLFASAQIIQHTRPPGNEKRCAKDCSSRGNVPALGVRRLLFV